MGQHDREAIRAQQLAAALARSSNIDFLLETEFPGSTRPNKLLNALEGLPEHDEARFRQFKRILEEQPDANLAILVVEAKERAIAAELSAAEAAEPARAYNRPGAMADFRHWCRMPTWTIEEGVALALGREPRLVTWSMVSQESQFSPFRRRFADLYDLAIRATHARELTPPPPPKQFVEWLIARDIERPEGLMAAMRQMGHSLEDLRHEVEAVANRSRRNIATLQQIIEQLKADNNALKLANEAASRGPNPKERESLLKLVIGMATAGYGYDPKARRSEILPDIVADLERMGVALDADTVRKYLKAGADLLPPLTEDAAD